MSFKTKIDVMLVWVCLITRHTQRGDSSGVSVCLHDCVSVQYVCAHVLQTNVCAKKAKLRGESEECEDDRAKLREGGAEGHEVIKAEEETRRRINANVPEWE